MAACGQAAATRCEGRYNAGHRGTCLWQEKAAAKLLFCLGEKSVVLSQAETSLGSDSYPVTKTMASDDGDIQR